MLFRSITLQQIAAGRVTLAFRRWRRPTVKLGGQLKTPIGVLAIESVDEVDEAEITQEHAERAGYASLEELRSDLAVREGVLYRVAFRRQEDDPRIELRQTIPKTGAELADAVRELELLDRKSGWTLQILRAIEQEPEKAAKYLASSLGLETAVFKRRVRQLKERGLTESLVVGYRLSPRGAALLRHIHSASERSSHS
jgi:hypothetical protein